MTQDIGFERSEHSGTRDPLPRGWWKRQEVYLRWGRGGLGRGKTYVLLQAGVKGAVGMGNNAWREMTIACELD